MKICIRSYGGIFEGQQRLSDMTPKALHNFYATALQTPGNTGTVLDSMEDFQNPLRIVVLRLGYIHRRRNHTLGQYPPRPIQKQKTAFLSNTEWCMTFRAGALPVTFFLRWPSLIQKRHQGTCWVILFLTHM